jgi:hypothetical protein
VDGVIDRRAVPDAVAPPGDGVALGEALGRGEMTLPCGSPFPGRPEPVEPAVVLDGDGVTG